MSTRILSLGMAAIVACALGCQQPAEVSGAPAVRPAGTARPLVVGAEVSAPQPHSPSFDGGALEFIPSTFEELYPVFLIRRSMTQGQKAELWSRKFLGRWVRWSGIVRSKTPYGLTVRHLPATTTFDISLHVEPDQLALLNDVRVGDHVDFVGRLDTFDDIFRQFYLVHGALSGFTHEAVVDGGAP